MVIGHWSFRPWRRTAGFTLLELVLALSVVVVAAAITVPTMLRAYEDYRLKQAAQSIRNELAATRTRAIETGLPYQFRFEPGGGWFVSVPAELDGAPPAGAQVMTIAHDDHPRHSGQLPDGLTFAGGTDEQPAQRIRPEYLAGVSGADALQSVGWSPPLLFASDGTALDADVVLVDQAKGLSLAIHLRGLTGATTADHPVKGGSP